MAGNRFVYDFDEPSGGGKELLGGKGAGLAEMTQIGVPVPAGFTITTEACRAYMREGKRLPAGLEREIDEHVARLEARAGKRLGDTTDPLLLSVRSGAAVSMPGMMDTILNLGLSDAATEGLARQTANGIDAHEFEQRLADLKAAKGVRQDTDLGADDLKSLVGTFKSIHEAATGSPFPQDPREQLTRAV